MKENLNWNKIKKPLTVTYEEAIRDESYFFYQQAQCIKKHCESFMPISDSEELSAVHFQSRKLNEQTRCQILPSKVISIVGDRGSGKSSLLETSRAILSHAGYYVMDTMDPSTFNDSMNVTELLLSKCYKELKDREYVLSENKELESLKQEIYTQLKNSLRVLNNLRLTKNNYIENNMTHEILEDYMERESFSETIKKVSDLMLRMVNQTQKEKVGKFHTLALLIDDLDLVDNYEIYNMTEDIRKYLATSVVVVIAYRETQLQNAILQTLIEKNQKLLAQNLIDTAELKDQASKYLEKLAPYATRVFMPVEEELYAAKMKDVISAIIDESNINEKEKTLLEVFINPYDTTIEISLKDWLYTALGAKIKLDLEPMDKKENTRSQFPNNLRGVLDLIKIVQTDMRSTKGSIGNAEIAKTVLENIKIYTTYFRSFCNQILKYEQYEVLRNWETATNQNKNFTIYSDLWNRYFRDANIELWASQSRSTRLRPVKDESIYPLDILKVQPANVALADVYILLDDVKTLATKSFNELNFIYVIKVFYSLKLTELFLKAYLCYLTQGIENNSPLETYLTLLNSYIVPKYALQDIENQYKVSWVFNFDKDCYANSNSSTYKQFIDSIVYSVIPEEGDVMQEARAKINRPTRTQLQRAYRFRNVFSYDRIDFMDAEIFPRKNFSLGYDVFGFLGKKAYLENVFKSYEKENTKKAYALTSMFDIDKFVFMNYIRRSEKNPIGYFIRVLNRGLGGEFNNEKLLLNRRLIEADYNNKKSHIYSEVLSDFVSEFDFTLFDNGLKEKKNDQTANGTFVDNQNIHVKGLTLEKFNSIKDIFIIMEIAKQNLLIRKDLSKEDKDFVLDLINKETCPPTRKNKLWQLLKKYEIVQ